MGGDANIAHDVRIQFRRVKQGAAPLSRSDRMENAFLGSRPGQAWMRWLRRMRPGSRMRKSAFRQGVPLNLRTVLAYDRRGLAVYFETDAEIVVPPWPGLAERYIGPDGFMDFFEAWTESWDQIELELTEMFDLGESSLIFGRMHTRGGASGVDTHQPFSAIFEYGAAKVSRGQWFLSWEEGLAAAGLEDELLPD